MNFNLTDKEIETLFRAGEQSPSGGNVQPWNVSLKKNLIEVTLDPIRSKISDFLDVHCFASIFALGCFTENILIAARSLGLKFNYELKTSEKVEYFKVQITFFGREKVYTTEDLSIYVPKRVTNRQISDGTVIDQKDIELLIKQCLAFSKGQFNLNTCSSSTSKKNIARILGKADGIRMTKQETYEQMMREFRWSESEAKLSKDGLDLKTLELPGNVEKLFFLIRDYPFIREKFPLKIFEDFAKPLLLNSSHLCCLSTNSSLSPQVLFEGGRILERIWLISTKLNLAFQPWTPLIYFLIRTDYFKGEGFSKEEIKSVRNLGKLLRKEFSLKNKANLVFFFRLSKAKPASYRSIKRSWSEFVTIN
ncbi:hypothetical protein HY025_05440 [Candidatus Daviesbacteria bacterium]|nr:hypothetical protein [Candidatus Daviesbacteria bacterium]